MDDDRYDRTAPANRPHEFDMGGRETAKTCSLCSRGSGHHVHDVSPFPENHPHEYVPADPNSEDYTGPYCGVCGMDKGHALHDVSPFPENHPHVFEPGGVTVEGVGAYCKVCGFLENAFDHAHIAPDPVNQPAHYTAHPSGVECIQITEHMSFNLGNAVKYIWRADLKGDAITDLEKARWYLEREITRRTQE